MCMWERCEWPGCGDPEVYLRWLGYDLCEVHWKTVSGLTRVMTAEDIKAGLAATRARSQAAASEVGVDGLEAVATEEA